MKKSSVLFVFVLVTLLSTMSFAKLELQLPAELSADKDMFSFTNDNLSLNRNTTALKLSTPEIAAVPQSGVPNMMLSLSLILSLPTGDFGDVYNTGIGGDLTFGYLVNPNILLTGSIGYISWGGDDNEFYGGDFSISSVPFLVGARYLFPTSSSFSPYVLGEIGLHFMSASYEYSYYGYTSEGSTSSTEFALGLGGGFIYPLSPVLSLDVNGRYWIISDAGNFAFMAGIGYSLGAM